LLRACRAALQKTVTPVSANTLTAELFECLLYAREKFFEDVWRGQTAFGDPLPPEARLTFDRAPNISTPLFFWLLLTPEDKPIDAVFMFTDAGKKTHGLGFATQEHQLLDVLADTFADRSEARATTAETGGL
jgi:hypothetical protein